MSEFIRVRNAREHNLQGVDLDLERNRLIVFTGVSGSGKSSLAFDTIYQEGQRRFVESLSAYARQFLGQMERPKVDLVDGLSPTLAIDQKTVNRNPRSTVGTVTEIHDHLRLLYARLGTPRCPVCRSAIARRGPGDIADRLMRDHEGRRALVLAPVVRDRKGEYRKELEGWRRDGWVRVRIDGQVRSLEDDLELARYEKHTIELVVDRLVLAWDERSRLAESIERAVGLAEGVCSTLVDDVWELHATARACPTHGISIPEMEPRLFSFNAPQGACPTCMGIGRVVGDGRGGWVPAPHEAPSTPRVACPSCAGRRLNAVALAVDFRSRGIDEVASMSIEDARAFFDAVVLEGAEARIGEGVVKEIRERLRFLDGVGLGYLSLSRAANTLSGGESQRIRLAACVGTGLQGVTYVLDEPSIGLHARDNSRLLDALCRLRDLGNTVLVVEHDRETMERADCIVDVGPGAGRLGGRIVGMGAPAAFVQGTSDTARFLRDEARIPVPARRRTGNGTFLRVRGAREHNLRGVDLDVPLGTFTVLSGPSGSGKSTLLFDVIDAGLRAGTLDGAEHVDKVVEIDQAPIGRTPRSNPATYTGAFDHIRDLFASIPEAKACGYKKGTFSFNVKGGRCAACEGAGVKTIEMSFLADVEIPCDVCHGRRFTAQTLEIRWKGRSIADVLEMTVDEAVDFFAHHKALHRILATMQQVGLGYVHLGQTATTLSGGEAQRVKLATELQRPPTGRTVYLLDEPTTGLHFQDVRVLVDALQSLVDAGNTVLVIEHNLDLVKAADLLVELGPEGGSRGGLVLAVGSPEALARTDTATGLALAALPELGGAARTFAAEPPPRPYDARPAELVVRGARCHNLRAVDVTIPHDKLTVITGVSGSGKTSLAFDTIFAEGQRRYVESLSTYARRFLGRLDRAPVDEVVGLAPAIAIDQKSSAHNPRSTVATVTEIHDHFRLLWARVGIKHCPHCAERIVATPPALAHERLGAGRGRLVARLPRPLPAAELRDAGFARAWIDGREVPLTDQKQVGELVVDRLDPAEDPARTAESVAVAYRMGGGRARFLPAEGAPVGLSEGEACTTHGRVVPEDLTPRHFSFNHYLGACPACEGLGRKRMHRAWWKRDDAPELLADLAPGERCPACKGARLRPEILAVRLGGLGIHEAGRQTVDEARTFFAALALEGTARTIAEQPLAEITARLRFLADVGLGYLTLDRSAATLSGGESQRIRLASQLGSGLVGCLYVLDEPTVGLHPRDTGMLLGTLEKLRALGNTLVLVEHDPETIRRADHVIDLGPGAGEFGGRVLAAGPPGSLGGESLTGAFLRGERGIPMPARRREAGPPIRLGGARRHNLRDLAVDFPTRQLIAVTGVSGSGKSTLVMDVLVAAMEGRADPGVTLRWPGAPLPHVVVDQEPIGRSPRSTPATYVGVLDLIRDLYAATPLAKARGYGSGRFSYNGGLGACAVCGGHGQEVVEMHFLSNVWVRCETCRGRRYDRETLDVRWRGHTIADVLDLRVEAALELFAAHRKITRTLQALVDVGLGYLRLGQSATELSGGEAQRVKLAVGLTDRTAETVYVLDEPTTGLHLADVERLLGVLDRLVDRGNTVIVVEHHLDVIRHADLVLDLGPEAGEGGGRLVARGTPEEVARVPASWTGQALAAMG